jgi:hypothetical protein
VPEVREPPPAEDLAALQKILAETKAAQAEYAHFSQEQVSAWASSNSRPATAALAPAALSRPPSASPRARLVVCAACAHQLAPRLLQVDKIFKAAALAANAARIPLAKLAAQETGMGVIEDKVIKIAFRCARRCTPLFVSGTALTMPPAVPNSSEFIYNKYKARSAVMTQQITGR